MSEQHAPAQPPRPVVLAIGGHDPSGGAGIQADIETIHALGGQPVTLVTAQTAQNTQRFERCLAVAAPELRRQAELLLQDVSVDVIKIGLLPSAEVADVVIGIVASLDRLPVVLDPVLAAGAGTELADEATLRALRQLLARVIVVTPNSHEARQLSGKQQITEAAEALLASGCRHVLITGTHEQTPEVTNTLYSTTRCLSWTWPRLAPIYHGSGCTLASAVATLLGTGLAMDSAAGLAQEYTWHALREGWALGKGQYHPRRLCGTASLF